MKKKKNNNTRKHTHTYGHRSPALNVLSWVPRYVLSGVRQGTVVWPLLFLAYINDFPDGTTSDISLFAEDYFVYREIKNQQDATTLQRDLTV
jgi:hypothetical protein